MNILNYYHQSTKKSRSFFAKHVNGRRIDIFLFIAALIVLSLITVNRIFKSVNRHKRIDIGISSQCENLFGRDTVNALIGEFEEQNPDLRIQVTTEENADIVFFDDSEFIGLMNDSALASLVPYIHTESQPGQQDAQWALPLVSFMDLFFYNIDILKAANFDRPPKTRAEFLAAARAVAKEESSVFAFALGLSQTDPLALRRGFYPWIWMDGGDIQDAGASRIVTNTVSFFDQLNREGLLAPGTLEKTGFAMLEEFAKGKVAMITASARDLAFMRRNAQDVNFSITAIPATTLGKNRLGLSGIYAGISSDCTLPDEAWIFLAFIAGKNQILARTLGAVPGTFPNAFPGEYIQQDPLYSKAWDIFEAADIIENNPGQTMNEEADRVMWEKLTEIFVDK